MKLSPSGIIRWSTLIKHCGRPQSADGVSDADYYAAIKANRVVTVHHGEEYRDAFYGEPGHTVCNVVERFIFPRPLPAGIKLVIGVKPLLQS